MFKNRIRAAAAGIAAVAAISVMSLGGGAAASPARSDVRAPITGCAFQTITGNYVTAVGGGGRITDVIHTDAPWIRSWEKFALRSLGNGHWAIQTIDGHYLTAVGGGGRITDTVHSDATRVGSWEKFRISCGH
jgi:hypothetical protein